MDSGPNASALLNAWIEAPNAPADRRATISKELWRWRIVLKSEAGSIWADAESFPEAVHDALTSARESGL